jgi:hypothetical protein
MAASATDLDTPCLKLRYAHFEHGCILHVGRPFRPIPKGVHSSGMEGFDGHINEMMSG